MPQNYLKQNNFIYKGVAMNIKSIIFCFLLCFVFSSFPLSGEDINVFPFPRESYRLDNGMEVVLIKYGNDGLMMDLLVVDVGVRFEKKPDEIEYTHLLEHLMFRGSQNYNMEEAYDIYTRYGIYDQGFTASDFTCYYRIFPQEAFSDLSKIMADKFIDLSFTDEEYKAETGAVLGEYLGEYQTPWSMLTSKLYQTAYTVHPYRDVEEHLEVLRKMPENREAVMNLYNNYYKSNNCRLVVAGDFDTEKVKKIIEESYGVLKPGKDLPDVPQEPLQEEERSAQIIYPGKTSPYIFIAYKLPSYDLNNIETQSVDLIKEMYFSEGCPLYNRLVYEEKLATSIYFPRYYFTEDPGLFPVVLNLKNESDIERVKEIFFEEVEKIRQELCSGEKLKETKEKTLYKKLTGLDSLEKIGFTFMNSYFLSHDPEGIDKYYENYLKVTPEDLQATAKKYFSENNRTVITLVEGKEEE